MGTAFAQWQLPADTAPYTNSNNAALWAPDVSYHNGEYVMYYSASNTGRMKSAVLLVSCGRDATARLFAANLLHAKAKSKTGLPNSWVDEGVIVATNEGCSWNAIDP